MADRPELTEGRQVVVVLGATATGKTELAVRIAAEFEGEVINADSRYFYRGMDIGTAKPDLEERQGIVHHLIDILEPDERYSLGQFLRDVFVAIEDVGRRGRLPVVAGGTPQYLRALLEGWTVPEAPPDDEIRARLDRQPTADLYRRLEAIDPASAARIGPANKRRMIRALEVFEVTGKPMSEQTGASRPPYRFQILGLTQDRERLYSRIDARVRRMHNEGWLDEVRRLHDRGITAQHAAMSAHGYREALEVVEGQTTIEDAIARTCSMIHRYVRHQQTWFRRFEGVYWHDSGTAGWLDEAVAGVGAFLTETE